ncbi:radical SAM protein [Paenibacillus sp. JX-17]|uniref:Radical SAM protein n=1 Tax=Paenibacillus lacisoli TaxID=3064525 RepID=A0ABT9CGD7_9BACL|nr:radical SAM protein [Paenibacillus sp. JX-17]MDO7907960.1 radical SAM protein [Paenibacillus sp. JX-17]
MMIEIKEIFAKKILTEASGYLDVGYTHSLNAYSGCAFACSYCYVREMPIQKFRDVPWGQWVDIKLNAADNYRNEMQKLRKKKKPVRLFMSSATDPYQPLEQKAGITRAILEAMLEQPPDMVQIQTRSPWVTRDIDILQQLQNKCEVLISMTIETDRDEVRRLFAPYAPGIKQRIEALKKLHEAGITTQASISPVLPFTPDFPQSLIGAADYIWIDTLIIGDGSMGRRSARLGMPGRFAEHGFEKWYEPNLHLKVEKYFEKWYPSDRVRVSRDEALSK